MRKPYNRFSDDQFKRLLALLEVCHREFPRAFPRQGEGDVIPLKLGIDIDLTRALQEKGIDASRKAVRRLLSYWTVRGFYLRSMAKGTIRIGLDGVQEGDVDENSRSVAVMKILQREQSKKQPKKSVAA
ncbi:ProQ/FINO family protein [Pseudomonas aeruginosa]